MPENPSSSSKSAAGDGRRERWRAHREARRRELVRAVADVVRRCGPLGMDEIATETGIAKQVFYRYFVDKADLHLAVSRAVARSVVAEVTRALADAQTPQEQLQAAIGRYLQLLEAEPDLYRYVVAVPEARAGADVVEDYSTVLGLHVTRLIGDLLRANGHDAGAAEAWGFAVVGAVRSAADRWLASPTLSRGALTDYLAGYLWSGLRLALPTSDDASGAQGLRVIGGEAGAPS
jgi:AcrR family transcriptional regulator